MRSDLSSLLCVQEEDATARELTSGRPSPRLDQASGTRGRPCRESAGRCRAADRMSPTVRGWTVSGDTLSDLLRAVRFRGALFYYIEGASPWVAEAPPAAEIIPAILPGAEHMIEFHGVVKGSCWAAIVGRVAHPSRGGRRRPLPAGRPARDVERAGNARPRRRHELLLLAPAAAAALRAQHDGGRDHDGPPRRRRAGTRPRSSAASWGSTRGPSTRCWPRSRACCRCPGARSGPTRG